MSLNSIGQPPASSTNTWQKVDHSQCSNKTLGLGQERLEFNGRRQYPEWLHVIAMTIDITTRLLIELDTFFTATTQEAGILAYPTDPQLTPATRRRLETIQSRRSTRSNR